MITIERIKAFLDKQYLACNKSTLLSLYDACKEMADNDAKAFLKKFYQSQVETYGKKSLIDRWYDQEAEIASEEASKLKGDTSLIEETAVHTCMPNSVRYGPDHIKNKYHKKF